MYINQLYIVLPNENVNFVYLYIITDHQLNIVLSNENANFISLNCESKVKG